MRCKTKQIFKNNRNCSKIWKGSGWITRIYKPVKFSKQNRWIPPTQKRNNRIGNYFTARTSRKNLKKMKLPKKFQLDQFWSFKCLKMFKFNSNQFENHQISQIFTIKLTLVCILDQFDYFTFRLFYSVCQFEVPAPLQIRVFAPCLGFLP